LDNKVLNSVE